MFPRLLDIGPIHVATYGVFVALSYLTGILWLKRQRERLGLSEDQFWTLIYAVFFGAVLGGKLMFMGLNWRQFVSGELGVIRDFRYGFVFYGGQLGSLAAGYWAVRRIGASFPRVLDLFGVIGPIGHAIGRIGCLGAGCCHGAPTDLPWGIVFSNRDSLVPDSLLGVPLHPSQLYEAFGNLVIAAVAWRLLVRSREGRVPPGTAFAVYVCLYGALRFLVEFTRADERGGFWLGLSPAQWIALGLMAATLALTALARREKAA